MLTFLFLSILNFVATSPLEIVSILFSWALVSIVATLLTVSTISLTVLLFWPSVTFPATFIFLTANVESLALNNKSTCFLKDGNSDVSEPNITEAYASPAADTTLYLLLSLLNVLAPVIVWAVLVSTILATVTVFVPLLK